MLFRKREAFCKKSVRTGWGNCLKFVAKPIGTGIIEVKRSRLSRRIGTMRPAVAGIHGKRGSGTMRTIIRNGTVVREGERISADVLTENGTIRRIAPQIDEPADREIDATGCYVLPGFIDTHTHLDLDLTNTVTADDFETGTRRRRHDDRARFCDAGSRYDAAGGAR